MTAGQSVASTRLQLRRAWEILSQPASLLATLRYRVTRDALPFTRQTLAALPETPDPARRRLVLFAHFDPQDEVDDYVRFYLEKLHDLGSTIVFVSGSPNLKPESADKIRPFCAGIFTRRTLSLDFGSWHLAWQQVLARGWRLEDFTQLILANDSVYGPLFPLSEMFESFTGADMYGMTESNESANHLQSYLLAWDLNDRTRPFLHAFWDRFRYVVRKQDLIDRYELGISRQARAAGLRLKAYAPDAAVRAALASHPKHQHMQEVAGRSVNNTLYLWDILIEDLRCPLLKTDLPRRNRYNSRKITTLSAELRQHTNYDPGLIERHLRRLAGAPTEETSGG